MLSLAVSIWQFVNTRDTSPGGSSNALLLENGNGISLEDSSGVLLLEG